MYGVSKISIETSLMMISVQDVEFKGNSLARYLQIFADNGVVVDMISQSAPQAEPVWRGNGHQLRRGCPCPECSRNGGH